MVFNPNIPQSGDDPTVSQPQLLGNFQTMATDFAVNHIPLTQGGSTQGYHTQVWYNNVLGPDPNLVAPQSSLYTKGSPPQLFYQNGNTSANVVQLTNLPVTSSGTNYGFKTPWGWIINMGLSNFNAGQSFAVPYVTGTFYGAFLTPTGGNANFSIVSLTTTAIAWNTSVSLSYYYLVIGI